ncbi:hypothetical protein NECAME_10725 [Necator americanus]|uniref:Uncharacterized protein n=1 Tax=Necator americanus TaxID=51031 RepID=W2T7Q4_NECAM|nr:hypothetical protein NECAME_10725 [Necator americanus]ETN77893.1 hypothetical protein NECAME_10725 [Necator americanus]
MTGDQDAGNTKKSTIRRSSILRDLKRVKNTEHRKGVRSLAEVGCDCMAQLETSEGLGLRTTTNSDIGNGEARHTSVPSENAFMERIISEQILPRMSLGRSVMPEEFKNRLRRILKRIDRSLQQQEIREEVNTSFLTYE